MCCPSTRRARTGDSPSLTTARWTRAQLRDRLAGAGWSKADIRNYLHRHARVRRGDWERVGKASVVSDANRNQEYGALQSPADLLIVAAGGPAGGFAAVIPPWFGNKSRAVTAGVGFCLEC